jgi:hypothetical protein
MYVCMGVYEGVGGWVGVFFFSWCSITGPPRSAPTERGGGRTARWVAVCVGGWVCVLLGLVGWSEVCCGCVVWFFVCLFGCLVGWIGFPPGAPSRWANTSLTHHSLSLSLTHTHARTHARTQTHTNQHTHTPTNQHTHTHTPTHTHTYTDKGVPARRVPGRPDKARKVRGAGGDGGRGGKYSIYLYI